MGNTFGPAEDAAMQTKILQDALNFAVTATEPGVLVDLPYKWGGGFAYFTGPTSPEAIEKQLKK